MARKPSERRNFKEADDDINLTPMMNVIAILIPALLVSASFIEITVVNVAAPAIGSAPEQQEQPQSDKPPLNLTVTITDKGYTVAGSGGVIGGAGAGAGEDTSGPTIPLIQRTLDCGRFLGTVPPPRQKNLGGGPCKDSAETRSFSVYDTESLTKKLVELKDAFPDERRIIIAAEPDTEFESITDLMDASRSVKDPGGELRDLFDEVVLSPGMS